MPAARAAAPVKVLALSDARARDRLFAPPDPALMPAHRWTSRSAAVVGASDTAQLSAMPVVYEFIGDVLEVRASGTYPAGEVERVFGAAIADPTRPALRALLYDARESAVIATRSTQDVQQAVDFFRRLGPHIGKRLALLAATDAVYGVMRMVAGWAAAADIEAVVFRDRAEALAWAAT